MESLPGIRHRGQRCEMPFNKFTRRMGACRLTLYVRVCVRGVHLLWKFRLSFQIYGTYGEFEGNGSTGAGMTAPPVPPRKARPNSTFDLQAATDSDQPTVLIKVYVAKGSYTATDDDELSFKEGDQIFIAREDVDGWWLAVAQSDGSVG